MMAGVVVLVLLLVLVLVGVVWWHGALLLWFLLC